jgi:maleylpyruvate isomerase
LPRSLPITLRNVETRELDRDVTGCAASHQLLLASFDNLTDLQAASPSLLPDWNVGHVLTHLARNADSHTLMLEAAERGEVADQYPGGVQQRAADIESGAQRVAAELVQDVRASIYRLEGCWATLSQGWLGEGRTVRGVAKITDLPFLRWREVAVHHADLGLGYSWPDWPGDYVRIELGRMTALWGSRRPMGLTTLPPEALAAQQTHRLAWLMGRAAIDGLEPAGIF